MYVIEFLFLKYTTLRRKIYLKLIILNYNKFIGKTASKGKAIKFKINIFYKFFESAKQSN